MKGFNSAEIVELIANNKIDSAITKLRQITFSFNNKRFYQAVILQSSKYEEYKQQKRDEISSTADLNITISKIRAALLQIVTDVKRYQNGETSFDNSDNQDDRKKYWIIGLGLLFLIVVGIIAFQISDNTTASQPTEPISTPEQVPPIEEETFIATFYLHGENGKQQKPLENKGFINFILNGEKKSAPIGERGIAILKDLPVSVLGMDLKEIYITDADFLISASNSNLFFNKNGIYIKIEPKDKTEVEKPKPEKPEQRSQNTKPMDNQPSETTVSTSSVQPVKSEIKSIQVTCYTEPNRTFKLEDPYLKKTIRVTSDATGQIKYTISQALIDKGTVKVFYSDPNKKVIEDLWENPKISAGGCFTLNF